MELAYYRSAKESREVFSYHCEVSSGEVLGEERFTSLFYIMAITNVIAMAWVVGGDEGSSSQGIC